MHTKYHIAVTRPWTDSSLERLVPSISALQSHHSSFRRSPPSSGSSNISTIPSLPHPLPRFPIPTIIRQPSSSSVREPDRSSEYVTRKCRFLGEDLTGDYTKPFRVVVDGNSSQDLIGCSDKSEYPERGHGAGSHDSRAECSSFACDAHAHEGASCPAHQSWVCNCCVQSVDFFQSEKLAMIASFPLS